MIFIFLVALEIEFDKFNTLFLFKIGINNTKRPIAKRAAGHARFYNFYGLRGINDDKIFSNTDWSGYQNFFELFQIIIKRSVFLEKSLKFFFKFCKSIKVVHILLQRFLPVDRIRARIPVALCLLLKSTACQDETKRKFASPLDRQDGRFPNQYERVLARKAQTSLRAHSGLPGTWFVRAYKTCS